MSESLSFLEYWGLHERPFEPVTDARFYFQSGAHEEALARLSYLVEEQTMYLGMLTGEIGCGKSMTRQVFAAQIDNARHCLVQFENSCFEFEDYLRRMLEETGWDEVPPASAGPFAVYEAARARLRELAAERGQQLVLMFDEAQDMSPATLANLKRFSNLNDEGTGRLTIILIGQPELRPLVERLPALDQRISLRFHLRPLDQEDTAAYLRHRLLSAGHASGDLFGTGAQAVLFEVSQGVAREINRLAKLCLEAARAMGSPEVTAAHVYSVVEDLRRHQPMPELSQSPS